MFIAKKDIVQDIAVKLKVSNPKIRSSALFSVLGSFVSVSEFVTDKINTGTCLFDWIAPAGMVSFFLFCITKKLFCIALGGRYDNQ